ncbi:MAG: histidine phosphatase family protein [Blastocatellales bacterium]
MKIYLVRHGLTEENAQRIIQGWHPGQLSALGVEQVERLARRLKELRFDAIYSSDARRAADTARIIARHQSAPLQLSAELRERRMGVFQGRPAAEFEQALAKSGLPASDFTPEGGETLEQLRDRATSFAQALRARHRRQTLLLVSHGRWNGMLLATVAGMSPAEGLTLKQTNTCVNILECDESGGWRIHLLNCAAHLSDDGARSIVTSTDNG